MSDNSTSRLEYLKKRVIDLKNQTLIKDEIIQKLSKGGDEGNKTEMRINAIVTLLTSDKYLPGCDALLYSLAEHHKGSNLFDVIVLYTPNVATTTIKSLSRKYASVMMEKIDPISNVYDAADNKWDDDSANNGFSKLRIWGLDRLGYQKAIYIDCDCIVLTALDQLFNIDIGSLGMAAAPDLMPPDKFNAGVMVIRPNTLILDDMISKIGKLPSHDNGDTGFLNSYFSSWYSSPKQNRLGFKYNAQRTMYEFTKSSQGYWESIKPISILHFCSSPKPWFPQSSKGELEMIWWDTYIRSGEASKPILIGVPKQNGIKSEVEAAAASTVGASDNINITDVGDGSVASDDGKPPKVDGQSAESSNSSDDDEDDDGNGFGLTGGKSSTASASTPMNPMAKGFGDIEEEENLQKNVEMFMNTLSEEDRNELANLLSGLDEAIEGAFSNDQEVWAVDDETANNPYKS